MADPFRFEMSESEVQKQERIIALATEVLGDPKLAQKWLSTPKDVFGGKTPLEILDASDDAQVEDVLLQAYFGNI